MRRLLRAAVVMDCLIIAGGLFLLAVFAFLIGYDRGQDQ